jgi:protein-tyrosine phosphatase
MAASEQHLARQRELALLDYRNLRDMGGHKAPGERVIARGRIFRGSSPARFEAPEHQALLSLRLRSVIDLRTTEEVLSSNIKTHLPHLAVHHQPLFEAVRSSWVAPSDQGPRSTASRYLEMLDDSAGALVNIVLRVAHPDSAPVLVCCAAGRDRTGIVSACLLDLLEVDDDTIAADYARSDAFVHDGGRAHSATIVEFLNLIRRRYGSVHELLRGYGLPDSSVQGLRQALLVPAT